MQPDRPPAAADSAGRVVREVIRVRRKVYGQQMLTAVPRPMIYALALIALLLLLVAVFAEPLANLDQLPNYTPR